MTAVRDLAKLPVGSDGEWWVYSHVNRAGRTLYVGFTSQPRARHMMHRSRAKWWPKVAEVGLIGPWRVRSAALDAERTLIRARRPEFNVTHTPRGLRLAYRVNRRTAAARRAARRSEQASA